MDSTSASTTPRRRWTTDLQPRRRCTARPGFGTLGPARGRRGRRRRALPLHEAQGSGGGIFDVNAAAVIKTIELDADRALIAAVTSQLVVAYPGEPSFARWSLDDPGGRGTKVTSPISACSRPWRWGATRTVRWPSPGTPNPMIRTFITACSVSLTREHSKSSGVTAPPWEGSGSGRAQRPRAAAWSRPVVTSRSVHRPWAISSGSGRPRRRNVSYTVFIKAGRSRVAAVIGTSATLRPQRMERGSSRIELMCRRRFRAGSIRRP